MGGALPMSQGLSLLFVVDPLPLLKAYKDSTVAMMRTAAARGHDIWACTPAEMQWREGRVTARAQRIRLLRRQTRVRPGTPNSMPAQVRWRASTRC